MSNYEHRQSRWATPDRKHAKDVQLQSRDYGFLRLLFDYRYATSELLRQTVSPEPLPDKPSKRLKELFRAGYIARPAGQQDNFSANYSFLVYALTRLGIGALLDAGMVTADEVLWRTRLTTSASFWHDLRCANTVASLAMALPKGSFFNHYDVLRYAPKETQESPKPFTFQIGKHRITPDDVYVVKQGEDTFGRFLDETDMANESVERITSKGSEFFWKLETYDELLTRGDIQDQLNFAQKPYIAITTTTPGHMSTILKYIGGLKNRDRFIIRTLPDFNRTSRVPKPMPQIATEPWKRAGYPDFYMWKGGE